MKDFDPKMKAAFHRAGLAEAWELFEHGLGLIEIMPPPCKTVIRMIDRMERELLKLTASRELLLIELIETVDTLRMTLRDFRGEWWIVGPHGPLGPYRTKREAEDDRRGLIRSGC